MLSKITKESLLKVKRTEFEIPEEKIKGNFILTKEARERIQKIKIFLIQKFQ